MSTARTEFAEIKAFWEKSATTPLDADGLRPTARDPHLQQVVEAFIERHIPEGSKVYDIGCGDGLSTLRFAQRAGSVIGLDYVQAFVDTARHHAGQAANVTFEQADVLDLASAKARHGLADVSVTIRCLINLPTWDDQKVALKQIASTLKPGGLYVLSEGWSEGLAGLSQTRRQAGLPEMGAATYNTFISRSAFEAAIAPDFEIVGYESLGFYLFVSRVLQPALVHPAPPSHTHQVNKVAEDLSIRGVASGVFEDLDYAGIYVLRRRV